MGRRRVELRKLDARPGPTLDPQGQGPRRRRMAPPPAPPRAGAVARCGDPRAGRRARSLNATCPDGSPKPRCRSRRPALPSPERGGALPEMGPGRRGRCRASPPSEPDVRTLPHPVPRVSGSLRDVSAPDPRAPRTTVAPAPVWLSAAVALTQVMELRVSSRVSRQRFRSRGAPLPSAGSRWPRFPVFVSSMKALRLPTLRPSGLLFSPVSTMCARSICVVARALPMPRGQVVGPGFGV